MVNLDIHESGFRHTRSSVQIPPPCLLCRSVPPPQSRIRISAVTTCLVCGCVHFCVRAGVCVYNIHIHIYIYNRACVCVCIYVCIIYTQHVSYIHNMYTYTHIHICIRSFLRYAIKLPSPQIHPHKSPPPINQTNLVLKRKHPALYVLPIKIRVMYIYMYTYMYIYIHIYVFVAIQRNPFRNQPILLSTPYPSKYASSVRSQARRAYSGRLAPTAHRPEPFGHHKNRLCSSGHACVCACVCVCVCVCVTCQKRSA